jgi:hypothetical protein
MIVTLVVTLCHTLNGVPLCVEEQVTDTPSSIALAGKIDEPVPMPGLTWSACTVRGQTIVSDWMRQHPIYHADWRVTGWKCVPGRWVPSRNI